MKYGHRHAYEKLSKRSEMKTVPCSTALGIFFSVLLAMSMDMVPGRCKAMYHGRGGTCGGCESVQQQQQSREAPPVRREVLSVNLLVALADYSTVAQTKTH